MSSADTDGASAVACMSPLILQFLMHNHTFAVKSNRPLISLAADKVLREMFELVQNFNYECLEQFHALFEVLRFELQSVVCENHEMTLRELYPLALTSGSAKSCEMLDQIIPVLPRTLIQYSHQITPSLTRAWCHKHANAVVLPGPGNPGFDVAIPVDENRLIAVDTKFSKLRDIEDSSVNAKADVLGPRASLDKNLGKSSGTA